MTLCLPAPLRVNRVKALFDDQSVKYVEFDGSVLAMELYLRCARWKSSWTCGWPLVPLVAFVVWKLKTPGT